MKKVLMGVCMSVFVVSVVFAAQPKAYQVTGPVLEVGADKIIVQKGEDKWEIARDVATVVSGDLQVGAKVTIEYTMKAKSVEVKPAKAK